MAKVEVLRVAVDEQRRTHDELGSDLDSLQTKILTMFGGALALLAYLYVGGNLFIPKTVYGKVFYFVGLGLLLFALYNLIEAIRPSGQWEVATEVEKLKTLDESDELTYLEYVKDRYIAAYENNVDLYITIHDRLSRAFYPLFGGGIILVVLKSFGG